MHSTASASSRQFLSIVQSRASSLSRASNPSWTSFARSSASTRRSSARLSPHRCISSTPFRTSSSSQLPWFVEEEQPASSSSSSSSPSATTPRTLAPPPAPSHIPTSLHPLHQHLTVSPFLDPRSIAYIDAQAADPGGSWTDWVVVATLRQGRERGLRGAVEGIRVFLASNTVPRSSDENDRPFAPSHPTITGLPVAPSRHARSRNASKGGGSSSSSSTSADWAMVDAGDLVVHVMTADARELWGIEGLWQGVERENQRQQQRLSDMEG